MALIKCPECEKEISDKAAACPHCGCPASELLKESDNVSEEKPLDSEDEAAATSPINSKKYTKDIITIAVMVLIIIGLLVYFNTTKPSNVSDQMYSYGESAIKTIDDYMDNKIDYEAAINKLNGIKSSSERYAKDAESKDYDRDFYVNLDISYLDSKLYFEHSGHATYSELLEARNDLAKELNIGKRK